MFQLNHNTKNYVITQYQQFKLGLVENINFNLIFGRKIIHGKVGNIIIYFVCSTKPNQSAPVGTQSVQNLFPKMPVPLFLQSDNCYA